MELFDVTVAPCVDSGQRQDFPLEGMTGQGGREVGEFAEYVDDKDEVKSLEQIRGWEAAHPINRWSHAFQHPEVEEEFLEAKAVSTRAKISGALCVHCMCAAWQFRVVTCPTDSFYFQSHGQPEIAWRLRTVFAMMVTQVAAACAVGAVLVVWMWHWEIGTFLRRFLASLTRDGSRVRRDSGVSRTWGGGHEDGREDGRLGSQGVRTEDISVHDISMHGSVMSDTAQQRDDKKETLQRKHAAACKRRTSVAVYGMMFLVLLFQVTCMNVCVSMYVYTCACESTLHEYKSSRTL